MQRQISELIILGMPRAKGFDRATLSDKFGERLNQIRDGN